MSACRVLEVDHPATLARKRDTLLQALSAIPSHVKQVATDFNEKSFNDEMLAAGFDPSRKSFVIWEGVTGYLNADAVDATLRWIASAARGGELVFTYLHRDIITNAGNFGHDMKQVNRVLKKSSEPWTFGLEPEELRAYLAERDFELLEDLGANEFRARYLRDWPGGLQGYAFYRIAHARITR